MNITEIAKNTIRKQDGIFYSKDTSDISYPKEGNENCMQIEENSFWFRHRNGMILKALEKYNQNRTLFDIGGGNGFVAKAVQDNGKKVVLVEPGIHGALNASKRDVENVICATLENAGFEPSSIDSAGFFDVVEHIEDDQSFLKSIHHYLKEDGLIYITVPAYQFLWSNEDNYAGHYRRYTIKTMSKLLASCGYEVKYISYFFSILPLPVFLFRTIPSFLGIRKNSNNLNANKEEHKKRKGLASSILEKIWNWELNRMERGKRINFGGSCFVVAQKINQTG